MSEPKQGIRFVKIFRGINKPLTYTMETEARILTIEEKRLDKRENSAIELDEWEFNLLVAFIGEDR